MKRRLKINGIIIVIAISLLALFPGFFFRGYSAGAWDEVVEMLGVAFILLGQIFRASARGYKAEYSLNGQALIEGGPYSFVRNPMYLGILFIGFGIVLLLFNWWVMIIFLLVFFIRYILLIFTEEKKLMRLFAQTYAGYTKRVPRILPSLYSIISTDIRQYLPLKFLWIKREIGTISAILLGTLFIESREDIRREGVRAYLRETMLIAITIILFIIIVIYLSRRTDGSARSISSTSKSN